MPSYCSCYQPYWPHSNSHRFRSSTHRYTRPGWAAGGLAIFPSVIRAGLVFGGAYGRGLVIVRSKLIGNTSQSVFNLGPQVGVQSYSQVILFKDAALMEWFKHAHLEFSGRASVVAFKRGATVDPGYNPSVAVFSLTKGGLMFEAAAAGM